jgi:DNA-binding CsgD family transcriptional regulator
LESKESNSRIERLLVALLLQSMKGTSLTERIKVLNMAGFSNVEVADILDVTAHSVSQQLYAAQKAKRPRKVSKK